MKGRVRVGIAAAFVVGLLSFGAAPSLAANVQCGDTITQDTVLNGDLDCTALFTGQPDFAIRTGASNLTFDLNGHTILLGNGNAGIAQGAAGPVTIENGSIVGVGANPSLRCGGAVNASSDITVRNVTIERCHYGIFLTGSNNTIVQNQVREYATGLDDETPPFAIAIDPREAEVFPQNNVISRNVIFNSTTTAPPGPFHSEFGISVHSSNSQIDRNFVSGNQSSLFVHGSQDVVEQNSITRNHGESAMGLALGSGLVSGNRVTDDRGSAAGANGITECLCTGTGTLIEKNFVSGFRNNGIQILNPESDYVVAKNRANFNGNYGIAVAPGTIDGGGNKARGNGNPAQCLNVFCK
jgi:parallel beta-helix repeat protein